QVQLLGSGIAEIEVKRLESATEKELREVLKIIIASGNESGEDEELNDLEDTEFDENSESSDGVGEENKNTVFLSEGEKEGKRLFTELKNSGKIEIGKGQRKMIGRRLRSSGDFEVEWHSMDDSIVGVSTDGEIEGLRDGRTFVRASLKNDPSMYREYEVEVKSHIPVEGVLIVGGEGRRANRQLVEGGELQLEIEIKPENATNKSVEWDREGDAIRVSQSGVVKGLKEGYAKAIVRSEDGGIESSIEIKVVKRIAVDQIVLNKKNLSLYEGEEDDLTAEVIPSNATQQRIKWEISSGNGVVSISNTGRVKGEKEGKAKIIASIEGEDEFAWCDIEVVKKVDVKEIRIYPNHLRINEGESESVMIVVLPMDASNKSFEWDIADEKVVAVEGGSLRGLKEGRTTVIVRSIDGGYTSSCEVIVDNPNKVRVQIKESGIAIEEGERKVLSATVSPKEREGELVEWSSDSEDVVKISADGVLEAVSAGVGIIRAKLVNIEGEEDWREVHVMATAQEIVLSRYSVNIGV
ncbi:MAG: Ig-like domain-containing protein, partial [Phocaeicola sp.]